MARAPRFEGDEVENAFDLMKARDAFSRMDRELKFGNFF